MKTSAITRQASLSSRHIGHDGRGVQQVCSKAGKVKQLYSTVIAMVLFETCGQTYTGCWSHNVTDWWVLRLQQWWLDNKRKGISSV